MDNPTFVFETLLRDNVFMDNIDDYIKNTIFASKTFDAKDVPQLVLLIMTLLERSKIDIETTIKNDTELKELLDIFYNYIFSTIEKNLYLMEFDKTELKKSYEICCRLALFKLKYKNKNIFACIAK